MSFKNAYIPYGLYWSTPFSRWQGSFQNLHAIKFAAETTTRFLNSNNITPNEFDELLGTNKELRDMEDHLQSTDFLNSGKFENMLRKQGINPAQFKDRISEHRKKMKFELMVEGLKT